MGLKHSYTLLAPIYDLMVERATMSLRMASLFEFEQTLNHIKHTQPCVLISGIGTGLDLPHLPAGPEYVGIDLTPMMLKRAEGRAAGHNIRLETGDVMALPYDDNSFEAVIMHLILAVVPEPQRALLEAQRVLKPGGHVFIVDKFLGVNQKAPLRRLLSPLFGQIATQTNVVFETLLAQCHDLQVIKDEPSLVNGWFRRIILCKQEQQ
jgi:phosphatidylethanolamine/phosphatidyl-N-methylethanolamine N-methyltransferase